MYVYMCTWNKGHKISQRRGPAKRIMSQLRSLQLL